MKTFKQWAEEKENTRRQHLRFEPGANHTDHYIGVAYENGKYTLLEGPRVRVGNVSFTAVADSLCDVIEEFPELNYDFNFSEQIPEHERDLLVRIMSNIREKKAR